MTTVTAIVILIRAKALNNRQFVGFLEEIETEYGDLILHSEVRWLSRGKVLDRFIDLLPHINNFFNSKHINIYDEYLCDIDWVRDLAFPTDITHHLNNLNLELQGKNQTILTIVTAVKFPLSKAKHLAQIFSLDCGRLEIDS